MRDGIAPSNGRNSKVPAPAFRARGHEPCFPARSAARPPDGLARRRPTLRRQCGVGRCHGTQGRHEMTKTLPDIDGHTDYTDPVRRLLSIGASPANGPAEWPDYAATYGLRSEHGTQLIRLACDAALYGSDPEGTAVWAPIHAWRTLGQLRAATSVPPLLTVLKSAGLDEDWMHTELPVVFGLIGSAAIPPVAAFISDQSQSTFPAATAIMGVKEIARRHPECRRECIGLLERTLERDGHTDPGLKGFAVSALMDLQAVEAIEVIRGAFRR